MGERGHYAPVARADLLWLVLLIATGVELAQGASEANSVVWCDDGVFDGVDFRRAVQSWNRTDGNGQLIVITHHNGAWTPDCLALKAGSSEGVGVRAGLPGEEDPWADASSSNWIATDVRQGPLAHCDIYLARSSAVPLYFQGLVEDLAVVRTDPRFQWEKLVYPARVYVGEVGSAIVSLPLEFDFPMLFYRRDLVFYPPTDWEDLLDMAQRLNSTDMNGDGVPDFGFCVDPAPHFGQLAFGIVASIVKTDQSTYTGIMYDVDPVSISLEPLFATEGYAYAFSIARRMWKLSRGDNWHGRRGRSSEKDWGDGKCAFYLTWAAGGGTAAEQQYIRGRSGFAMMPGSTKVFSRRTRQLENCTSSRCPLSRSVLNRPINQPTFEVGSKRLLVRKNVSNMNAVMDVLAAAVSAVRPWAEGVVPSREADLLNFSNYLAHGWDEGDAYSYLGAISASVSNRHIASVRLIPMIPTITGLFVDALENALFLSTNVSATTDMDIAAELATSIDIALGRSGYTTDTLMPDWLRSFFGRRDAPPLSGAHPEVGWLVASLGLLLVILAVVVAVALRHWRSRAQHPEASMTGDDQRPSKLDPERDDGSGPEWRSNFNTLTIVPGVPPHTANWTDREQSPEAPPKTRSPSLNETSATSTADGDDCSSGSE